MLKGRMEALGEVFVEAGMGDGLSCRIGNLPGAVCRSGWLDMMIDGYCNMY